MNKNISIENLTRGIIKENPTLVMLLGMCPTLGVSTSAENGLGMGLATLFVLILSNFGISVLKNLIPEGVRIPCYIIVIALSIFVLFFAIGLIVDFNGLLERKAELITFGIIFLLFLFALLILIFKPRPKFIFEENKITIIKNKNKTEISISDIQSMKFYAFKWKYLITMYMGDLADGGVTKIHIFLKNGEKIELGYIYLKDAKKVQELYPNLMEIVDS